MVWAPDSPDLWAPDSGSPNRWAPDSAGQLTLGRAVDLFLVRQIDVTLTEANRLHVGSGLTYGASASRIAVPFVKRREDHGLHFERVPRAT
jgi:hypothetical protein